MFGEAATNVPFVSTASIDIFFRMTVAASLNIRNTASVAEWLRAWDTLTMFEATVCGRS